MPGLLDPCRTWERGERLRVYWSRSILLQCIPSILTTAWRNNTLIPKWRSRSLLHWDECHGDFTVCVSVKWTLFFFTMPRLPFKAPPCMSIALTPARGEPATLAASLANERHPLASKMVSKLLVTASLRPESFKPWSTSHKHEWFL